MKSLETMLAPALHVAAALLQLTFDSPFALTDFLALPVAQISQIFNRAPQSLLITTAAQIVQISMSLTKSHFLELFPDSSLLQDLATKVGSTQIVNFALSSLFEYFFCQFIHYKFVFESDLPQ